MRGCPIKPEEVKTPERPSYVIELFNEMIDKNMQCNDVSIVNLNDICDAINEHPEYNGEDVIKRKWIDVKDLYRKVGWEVVAAHNNMFFIFSKKQTRF